MSRNVVLKPGAGAGQKVDRFRLGSLSEGTAVPRRLKHVSCSIREYSVTMVLGRDMWTPLVQD